MPLVGVPREETGMTVNNFSTALEAKRCIDALDRIESDILARAKNDLAEIALAHPGISGVAESLIGGVNDSAGASGLHSMKRELQGAIEIWEEAA